MHHYALQAGRTCPPNRQLVPHVHAGHSSAGKLYPSWQMRPYRQKIVAGISEVISAAPCYLSSGRRGACRHWHCHPDLTRRACPGVDL